MPTNPPPTDCPLGECLSLIGGTWTPNIIWYLGDGPRRFSDLKRDITGISSKVLTTRLRKLERDGTVFRKVEPTSPPTVTYELTEHGTQLRPVIDAIIEVGYKLKSAREARLDAGKIQSAVGSSTARSSTAEPSAVGSSVIGSSIPGSLKPDSVDSDGPDDSKED